MFIANFSNTDECDDPFVWMTVFPAGADILYQIHFATQEAAGAFLAFLPTFFGGPVQMLDSGAAS